jgi:hypothetical protein
LRPPFTQKQAHSADADVLKSIIVVNSVAESPTMVSLVTSLVTLLVSAIDRTIDRTFDRVIDRNRITEPPSSNHSFNPARRWLAVQVRNYIEHPEQVSELCETTSEIEDNAEFAARLLHLSSRSRHQIIDIFQIVIVLISTNFMQ